MENRLSSEEKKLLLQIARDSIAEAVTRGATAVRKVDNGNLASKRGCFVTIKTMGKLRGCIGSFTSAKPLYAAVQEMAVAAATRDPRFYPLGPEELDSVELEISVLSPLKKIDSIEEIQVGIHGLYIEKDMFRGVLLPQVATEYGWDRVTFLAQTCMKAGLDKEAWKNEADIYIFSAQVFSEK
jgi:AmmeMemoRadiSam system protein A